MIKLSDYLTADNIAILQAVNKWELLYKMIDLIEFSPEIKLDKNIVYQKIVEREKILSTGIGKGIAVPHVRIEESDKFYLAFAVLKNPIEYESIDSKPVRFVVMIISAPLMHKEYLKILSALVLVFKNEETCSKILNCSTAQNVYELIRKL